MKAIIIHSKAFTLVEVLIVLLIVSIIAGFGIPNYSKTLSKARARDAINNISIIHAANALYRVRVGANSAYSLLNTSGMTIGINQGLHLNINSSGGTVYTCAAAANECRATAAGGANDFRITGLLNNALSKGTNPSCSTTTNLCP